VLQGQGDDHTTLSKQVDFYIPRNMR
jgi:hypothetical protein